MVSSFLSPTMYSKICKLVPLPTVDIILTFKGKVLLIKRKMEPCKDMWWTIGGRQYLNETIEDASVRKLNEEVGIKNVKLIGSIGSVDAIFDVRHNVTSVVLASVDVLPIVRLNKDHSDYCWIDKIDYSNYHKYLIKILEYYFKNKSGLYKEN